MQLPPLQSQCLQKTYPIRRRTTLSSLLAACVAIGASVPALSQISLTKQAGKSQTNEQAMSILRQMAETYAHLPSLHQRSVYCSTMLAPGAVVTNAFTVIGDAPPTHPAITAAQNTAVKPAEADSADDSPNRRIDRAVELVYTQPNLLKITDSRPNAANPAEISTWVCDGKNFSAFVPGAHGQGNLLYTQEKAPGSIRGFARLRNVDGSSLELVMLMGINPFQNLNSNIATVQVEEPAIVRGVVTNVISMATSTHSEHDLVTLYIGRDDHLLHRMITDVTPFNNGNARIGDALDEIADGGRTGGAASGADRDHPLEADDTSMGQRTEAKRTHVVYDNIVTPLYNVDREMFAFTPPPGAGIFYPLGVKQQVNPNSKRMMDIIQKSIQAHGKPLKDVKDVHDVTEVHDVTP